MKIVIFNKIKFYDLDFDTLVKRTKKIKLILVPAAPALSNIDKDTSYLNALRSSDINIFDSGLFCLLLKFKNIHVRK